MFRAGMASLMPSLVMLCPGDRSHVSIACALSFAKARQVVSIVCILCLQSRDRVRVRCMFCGE